MAKKIRRCRLMEKGVWRFPGKISDRWSALQAPVECTSQIPRVCLRYVHWFVTARSAAVRAPSR